MLIMEDESQLHPLLQALVTYEERVIQCRQFWLVMLQDDGTYLAAWINEKGQVQTVSRDQWKSALTIAKDRWGT